MNLQDGITWTFRYTVIACMAGMVLGTIAAAVAALLFGFRNGSTFRTQRDQLTGRSVPGFLAWFLGWGAITVGVPFLTLVVFTGVELTGWIRGNPWVLAPIAAALLFALIVWAAVIYSRRQPKPAWMGMVEDDRLGAPTPDPGPLPDRRGWTDPAVWSDRSQGGL